jgi:hypothetical protein
MCIVYFINLVAHHDGLFVGLVIKLRNLTDPLFGSLDIALVIFVFISVLLNGV